MLSLGFTGRLRPVLRGCLALLVTSVTGCSLASLPSQHNPTCSWSSSPPANADALCTTSFDTLTKIVQAVQKGDNQAIKTIVTNPSVAARIMAYSRTQRVAHARRLHVVPSFTLETSGDLLGAGFYVLGKNDSGNVNSPETLYLKVKGRSATVVEDQPNQDW